MILHEEFKNCIDSVTKCIEDDDYKRISKLSESIFSLDLRETEKCKLLGELIERTTLLTSDDTMRISELCDLMVIEVK